MQQSPSPILTETQRQVLTQIAAGASISAAAQTACIHRNTVSNWRRTNPAFAAEFHFAARERALYWHDAASALAPKALEVLDSILHDETAPKSLRLRVALKVLDIASSPAKLESPQPEPATPDAEPVQQSETAAQIAQRVQAEYVAQTAQSNKIETVRRPPEPGRNSPCPCGSGVKYKRCCVAQRAAAA